MIDGISNWILSIAGIICLSVIVELIMPEGQLNRYIKGVFSFIVVFVIVLLLTSWASPIFFVPDNSSASDVVSIIAFVTFSSVKSVVSPVV